MIAAAAAAAIIATEKRRTDWPWSSGAAQCEQRAAAETGSLQLAQITSDIESSCGGMVGRGERAWVLSAAF